VNAKPLIRVGIAFIFLGIVAYTYQEGGDTSREPASQIWTVQAGADAMKTLALSPLSAAVVLVTGVGLVAIGTRKSA
jgi:hypothetical protein